MTRTQVCRDCGATVEEAGTFGMLEIVGYDWDSDDDDASSVQRVLGYRCAHRAECAERNVQRGHNPQALREIVKDREHFSADLRERARKVLHEMAEVVQMAARGADAAAREQGYGQIGGGLH